MNIKEQQSNKEGKGGRVYCSLDIETSGFDPLADEILEVGFAFFTIDGKNNLSPSPSPQKERGIRITEEWTQVFKPSKPVPAQILGLTGISQKELDEAPQFSEHWEFIQEKLRDAVIVGHNVIFDIKFLEGFGIKFKGEVIDTLDLVQFILPTHHSYNLENLMHTFQIAHKEAHRALADAKATIKLLEKLLQVYSGFPEKLKDKIIKLISSSDFAWKSFLDVEFEPLVFSEITNVQLLKKPKASSVSFKLEPETIYNFPLDEDQSRILASSQEKLLLVVPKARTALDLFRQGTGDFTVFLPEQLFDEKKLNQLVKKTNLSPEEIKFLLKILVWQHTNWQSETLLDLNLSFFGGQFKGLVSGGEIKENKTAKVIACDLPTFLYLSENELYKDRRVVICGLNEFETAVTSNIGAKTSWGYVSYLLKSYYNPELSIGKEEFKIAVEAALLAGDLFFGLVNALFQTDPPGFQYIKVTPEFEYDEKFVKIKNAAESYLAKISLANETLASKEIEKFAENLGSFFKTEDNRVKWVELSENRCAFLSMPLDITSLVKNILKPFAAVSFSDSLDEKILPKFFLKRLGLENYKLKNAEQPSDNKKPNSIQRDLFSAVKKVFGKQPVNISYHCIEKAAGAKEIMSIIGDNETFPAAVLFSSPTLVREFYDEHYQQLKEKVSLFAQTGSGGSNKIFRNFGINKNSLLLCTDKFILKHLTNQNAVEPVNNLPVKTLIICRLPFEQWTHPYQEALSNALPNAFEDYSLPRALHNFQSIIKFFYSPELTDVYIIDAKLAKPYAKIFKEYGKTIPNAKLVV